MKNKEVIGTVLVLLTAFISGFAIFANKLFVAKVDPLLFTALRAIIIGAIFLILSLSYAQWQPKKIKKVSWTYLLAIGIIGGGFAFWMFFTGLSLTTAGRAGFIHKTLPIYATILAVVFLKEKVTKIQLLALCTMMVGLMALLFSTITPAELWANPQLGDLLIVGATMLWAIETTIAKKAMIKGENNFVVSFARMFFGALILFGVIIFVGKAPLLLQLNALQWTYIVLSTMILFGYILTYYWGLRYINASKAATLLLLAPVVTLLLGVTFLGEPISNLQILGSALILVGAYFVASTKSNVVSL